MKECKIVSVSPGKREITAEQSRSIFHFRGRLATDDHQQDG
jgi:hypothetical protein